MLLLSRRTIVSWVHISLVMTCRARRMVRLRRWVSRSMVELIREWRMPVVRLRRVLPGRPHSVDFRLVHAWHGIDIPDGFVAV